MRRPLPQTFKGLKDKSNKNDKTKIILYRLHNFWSAKSIQEVYIDKSLKTYIHQLNSVQNPFIDPKYYFHYTLKYKTTIYHIINNY